MVMMRAARMAAEEIKVDNMDRLSSSQNLIAPIKTIHLADGLGRAII